MRLAVLFAILAATAFAQEPPTTVEAAGGSGVSLSSPNAAVIPTASVIVEGPVFIGDKDGLARVVARVLVEARFSGLAGETVDLGNVATFNSVEVKGAVEHRIGLSDDGLSATYLEVRGQFATRLDGDKAPRVRHPRVYAAGIAFEHRTAQGIDRRADILYGRSEIASPDQWNGGQVIVEGMVKLFGIGQAGNKAVNLRVESHLNLGRVAGSGARDVTRAWVEGAVKWGAKA